VIAYCGIFCEECPSYKGTITGDKALLRWLFPWFLKGHGIPLYEGVAVSTGRGGFNIPHYCTRADFRACKKYE